MSSILSLEKVICTCIFLFFSSTTWCQEKIYLKCDGVSTVGATEGKNISTIEYKSFVKTKPMTLMVTIDNLKITIDNSYEYKNITTTFADKNTGYLFEYGGLEIKDSFYRGTLSREKYLQFKNASENSSERRLYFYKNTGFILDRFNGEFTWDITYYGNTSWINDLLPKKAKDKYVHLEVNGKCVKDTKKILF